MTQFGYSMRPADAILNSYKSGEFPNHVEGQAMGAVHHKLSLTLVAASATSLLTLAPPASGDYDNYAINGSFVTTSNGEWAQIHQQYHNVPTVRSTWTFSTTCRTATDCTGTVNSDRGWAAKASSTNGTWYVQRDLPDWQQCPDGTSAHGLQTYMFFPVDSTGYVDHDSTTFAGKDKTVGDSGNCGENNWFVVEMPFKMVKKI